jgi:rod shape-determining protein MreD
MRWLPVAILVYVAVVIQTTAGQFVTLHLPWMGPVSPDLLAMVTVFLAMRAATTVDAMLTGWLLGVAVDLTVGGGVGAGTVVGPMAVAYALAAGGLGRAREALFHEHALTQFLLALVFCLFTHTVWITAQSLVNLRDVTWGGYLQMLMQMLVSAFYTAALTPLVHYVLSRHTRWFVVGPISRRERMRARR